ncbi:MAG: hypothetical protein J4F37_10090 [Acidobacteria bacterium]|nr:hypothetical protein [Acidobacteriota bacterium]
MAVRTPDDLAEALARSLAWRKRELSSVGHEIERARRHVQPILLRSAICLLYAHWEGFVRTASTAYVELVARRRLRVGELSRGLLALSLRAELSAAVASHRIAEHRAVVDAVLDEDRRTSIRWKDAITPRSNLTYEALEEILQVLDFDRSRYATRRALINEKLVHRRNAVAHGEQLDLGRADYRDLQSSVLEMIEWFRDEIETSAVSQAYRKARTRAAGA